jgi:ABC-type nitrate/sulfonate/bicarbonate transport system permease component
MAKKKYTMSAKMVVYNIICVSVVWVLWTFFSRWQSSPLFPPPADILRAFVNLTVNGDIEGVKLGAHLLKSMGRILTGFGAACVLGIPLGLLMGLFPKIYNRTRFVTESVRFISPIAWIPLAIVILYGFSRYVFIIWLGGFFPIFIATILSIRSVDQIHIDAVRVLGASRSFVVRKIVIPSASPGIAAGMRISLGICWACIVAAEMIGGESVGIGRMILAYSLVLKMPQVLAGMLVLGVTGLIMNEIFIGVEKRVFRWREEVSIG